jgi:tetratricopeptide (TPR) repeat protein
MTARPYIHSRTLHPRLGQTFSFLKTNFVYLRLRFVCATLTLLLGIVLLSCHAYAAKSMAHKTPQRPPIESLKLQHCLKRADELPDMAAAEAMAWIKQGGGNDAHLCRAFAQVNRAMHADAAREFWALASRLRKSDPHRAAAMHDLAGQEFLRAKDIKNAEAQYTAALKLSPRDGDAYVGRAAAKMEAEKYWDAIGDLNYALKISPNNIDALRQRGRAWAQLGNSKNAQEDFEQAAALAGDAPSDDRSKDSAAETQGK